MRVKLAFGFLLLKRCSSSKKCRYLLPMFPYPSGQLHLGHLRVYTLSDVLARFERLQGNQVLHPIGWDSFGLPAENAARSHKIHPKRWTIANIKAMKQEFKQLNFDFDWDHEIDTSDPSYYKFTQALFLQLFDKGLAYQKDAWVHWDPIDGTVLANEQVTASGRSERSGALVERKLLRQWFLKMTEFSSELYDDLMHLNWPKNVIEYQRKWINKESGVLMQVQFRDKKSLNSMSSANVFLPNSLKFNQRLHVLVGWDHFLLKEKITQQHFKRFKNILLDIEAFDPIQEEWLPVYQSFDLGEFDARFQLGNEKIPAEFQCRLDHLLKENQAVDTVHYRLRDWLISRQRTWGTPIPVMSCPSCGIVPFPLDALPILNEDEMQCTCPKCGNPKAQRESDTMDTFVDSSWYWLRFCDPHNDKEFASKEATAKYLPVDMYMGGSEHAILHLLYARFIAKFLTREKLIDIPHGEPFQRLITQGVVKGTTFKDMNNVYYRQNECIVLNGKGFLKSNPSIELSIKHEKMSKSKLNGISLKSLLEKYEPDALRLYILSRTKIEQELDWNEQGIQGILKWIQRLNQCMHAMQLTTQSIVHSTEPSPFVFHLNNLNKKIHQAMQSEFDFHNVITQCMQLTRIIVDSPLPWQHEHKRNAFELLVQMLQPFAPTWTNSSMKALNLSKSWPKPMDASLHPTVECVVLVNNQKKVKLTLNTRNIQSDEDVIKQLLSMPNVQEYLMYKGTLKSIKKAYVAPGYKLVNILTCTKGDHQRE